MLDLDALREWMKECWPAKAKNAELSLLRVDRRGLEYLGTFHLIVYDGEGETRSIRDIKEQELFLFEEGLAQPIERLRAFFRAHVRVIEEILATRADIDTMMPYDLYNGAPLKLARAVSEEDFERALRVRSRFGALLQTR